MARKEQGGVRSPLSEKENRMYCIIFRYGHGNTAWQLRSPTIYDSAKDAQKQIDKIGKYDATKVYYGIAKLTER